MTRMIIGLSLFVAALATSACGSIPSADGDGGHTGTDGGGTPDATPQPGIVTITVLGDDTQPVSGATVIFTHPDGTTVPGGSTATNPQGKATATISAGDWAWIQFEESQNDASNITKITFTVVDLTPGQSVTVSAHDRPVASGQPVLVKNPLNGQAANTDAQLFYGCGETSLGNGTTSVTISVDPSCKDPGGKFRFLAVATDRTSGEIKQISRLDTAFTAVVTLPNWTVPSFPVTTVKYDNPVLMNGAPPMVTREFWSQFYVGRQSYLNGNVDIMPSPSTSITNTIPKLLAGFGPSIVGIITANSSNGNSQSGRILQIAGPGTVTIDGGAMLPYILDTSYNVQSHQFGWTVDGGAIARLANVDVAELILSSNDADNIISRSWTVVGPVSVIIPGFKPVVPSEIAADLPTATGIHSPAVIFIDYETRDSWHDVSSNLMLPIDLDGNFVGADETGVTITLAGFN